MLSVVWWECMKASYRRLALFLKLVAALKRAVRKCCSITGTSWVAAQQNHQNHFISLLLRCHFANSSDVDQNSNSWSSKYYFSWLQDCWTGSNLSSLVWLPHSGLDRKQPEYIQLLLLLAIFPPGESRDYSVGPLVPTSQQNVSACHASLGCSVGGMVPDIILWWEGQCEFRAFFFFRL